MAAFFTLGALLLTPSLLPTDLSWVATTCGLVMVAWLGLVATGLSYVLFQHGLARLPAGTVATLSLAEPGTAALLGPVVLREQLSVLTGVGIAIVVLSLGLVAVRRRPDWGEEDWARWAQLDRIVLCGGVLAGGRGDLVRSRFRAPGELGLPSVPVEVETDPATAPLRGLTTRPPLEAPTLVLDLGHSAVKAAVSTGPGHLGPVTRVRVPWTPFDVGTWPPPSVLLEVVRAAAAEARSRPRPDPAPAPVQVRVAIANYVVDGRLDEDDTWGTLGRNDELAADQLSRALGLPLTLLVNDGQAAALGRAGHPHTALISIGTSLGVGFPPPSAPPSAPRHD